MFLFSDGGIVSCVEGASGALVWRERVDAEFFGSPIAVGERLIALTKSGEVVMLAAQREFQRLGGFALGETSYATPAVAGGLLLLRTERHLHAFGAARSSAGDE
jgi:hypothetical protein